VGRDAKDKDAHLCGEVILFHVPKKASGSEVAATNKHASFKLNTKSFAVGLAVVIHAELSIGRKLIFLFKFAPAKRTPKQFKFSRWFQFLPHHFFSLY